MVWNDFNNLTANQRTLMASFEALGRQVLNPQPPAPTQTLSQAKAALRWLAELEALVGAARIGAGYARQYLLDKAANDLDLANP